MRKLQGRAIHVHISDCDGKVHGDLPPGRGVVEFGPYLDEIKALDARSELLGEQEPLSAFEPASVLAELESDLPTPLVPVGPAPS